MTPDNNSRTRIAVIGGSALDSLEQMENSRREMVNTPYGPASSPIVFVDLEGSEFVFIHRHGFGHTIAPHEINYRANIYALKKLDVTHIIGIAAVGGITEQMSPCTLVTPDQIIDYTHTRKQTYYEDSQERVEHVDFTQPYDEALRGVLARAAFELNLPMISKGTYGAVQGPRLETAAEINRLERDGCDLVGMTGMPEAVLARELAMKYACCAVVVNWAAGKGGQTGISLEDIHRNIRSSRKKLQNLLTRALPDVAGL